MTLTIKEKKLRKMIADEKKYIKAKLSGKWFRDRSLIDLNIFRSEKQRGKRLP